MASRWMKRCPASLTSRENPRNHHSAFSSLNIFPYSPPRKPSPFASLPCPQHPLSLRLTLVMTAGVFVPLRSVSVNNTERVCVHAFHSRSTRPRTVRCFSC